MNIRFTLLLVVLLVVVGGLVGVTQLLRSGDTPKRSERLYRLNSDELANITITQGGDQISFVRIGTNWFIEDKEGGANVPVDIDRWSGVPVLLNGPATQKNLTDDVEDPGDLTTFGLDPPQTRIKLTLNNGSNVEVIVGDMAPGEDGYYAKVVGTEPLYVMNSAWVEVFVRLLTEPPYPPE